MAWYKEVDTMTRRAGSAQTWHREETVTAEDASMDEWRNASGTNFTVSKMPLYVKRDDEFVGLKNSVAIVRDDNNARLGLFTDEYIPVQPKQITDFFEDFILADPRFRMDTMGAVKGGRVIWSLAEYVGEHGDSGTTRVLGAEHKFYALLATSFDGSLATRGGPVGERVVCRNTLQGAAHEASVISIKHNKVFDKIAQADALAAMAKIAEGFEGYKAFAESMHKTKLTYEQILAIMGDLAGVKPDVEVAQMPTRTRGLVMSLVTTLNETLAEPGSDELTAWTALNTVTRYVDHVRGTRRTVEGETDADARLASAQFGQGAAMKARAVKLLQGIA